MLPTSLQTFRHRRFLHQLWHHTASGLLIGSLTALSLATCAAVAGYRFSPIWPIAFSAIPAVFSAVFAIFKRETLQQTAAWLDEACNLQDSIATALEFSSLRERSPIQSLQVQLASHRLQMLNPTTLVPLHTPVRWKQALIAAAAAALLALVSPRLARTAAFAAPQISAATAAPQAQALQQQLRELQQQAPKDESLT
ncbi:MAG: hypothetical protein RL215_764, partial [Planctomycetota bacterium]